MNMIKRNGQKGCLLSQYFIDVIVNEIMYYCDDCIRLKTINYKKDINIEIRQYFEEESYDENLLELNIYYYKYCICRDIDNYFDIISTSRVTNNSIDINTNTLRNAIHIINNTTRCNPPTVVVPMNENINEPIDSDSSDSDTESDTNMRAYNRRLELSQKRRIKHRRKLEDRQWRDRDIRIGRY